MRRTNRRGFRTGSTGTKVAPFLLLGLLLCSLVYNNGRNESSSSSSWRNSINSGTPYRYRNGTLQAFSNHSDIALNVESIGVPPSKSDPPSSELPLDAPFRPIKVLQTYIEQHSHQALLHEFTNTTTTTASSSNRQQSWSWKERKYAVAYYWCPQRAGNILHSFFNTVVWSMIHNRTVLWVYHNTSNEEEDCQAVLKRAAWLPSYVEWKEKLGLEKDPVPVSNSALRVDGLLAAEAAQSHSVVLFPQIPDVLAHDKSITRIAWSDHPLKTTEFRNYINLLPSWNQNISAALYAEGVEFLYGMLYSQLFELQRPTASNTIGNSQNNPVLDDTKNETTFSLALHSRHTVGADDGSLVPHEQKCLEQLLEDHTGKDGGGSCRVHLMSDRPQTISILTHWLTTQQERNCSVVTAKHDSGDGPVKEHGPWAGAGYLEDLDVTARARHGIVGDPRRSSTALLIDLMDYRRKINIWQNGGGEASLDTVKNDLKVCKLPDKPISGYDYGPGTPTFRHHSYLEPLAPVRVVEDYIHHGRHQANNGIILVSLDFQRPTVEGVYTALNSFLYAIVNDMDIRWTAAKLDGSSFCDDGGSLKPAAWTEGFETAEAGYGNASILETSFDELLATGISGNGTDLSDDSLVVLLDELNALKTNFSEWNTLIADKSSSDGGRERLSDLFAHGSDVLFGLLFHELLSYCPFPDIQDEFLLPQVASSSAAVLQLESAVTNDMESLRTCIESIFFPSAGGSSDDRANADATCHVYILSDVPSIKETVLASMVLTAESESPRLMVRRDRFCSFSFYYTTSASHDLNKNTPQLSLFSWKGIQVAAGARRGWIRATEPRPKGTHSAALALTRGRLEYKRYFETWKQGREPFLIGQLPECLY